MEVVDRNPKTVRPATVGTTATHILVAACAVIRLSLGLVSDQKLSESGCVCVCERERERGRESLDTQDCTVRPGLGIGVIGPEMTAVLHRDSGITSIECGYVAQFFQRSLIGFGDPIERRIV